MAVFLGLNEHNVAPTSAKKIGVFKNGTLVGSIPLGNLNKSRGQLLYKVGLLSDVHQDVTNDETESENDLRNALNLYSQLGCDFCICAGDIVLEATLPNKQPEYVNYGKVVSAQDLEVYSCTGNHDVWVWSESDWKKYVNAKSQTRYSDVNYVSGGTNSSFEITKGNDHYLFLSMQKWVPSDSEPNNALERAYSAEELAWVASKLEEYRNERTFVITHLFFPDGPGNFYKDNAHYNQNNILAGDALSSLVNLRAKYPNTIWFSGHSHWKWYLQRVNASDNSFRGRYCNVMRATSGAWMVHLPSSARPIDAKEVNGVWETDKDNSCYGMASEGGIMYVYENAIEIQGISLKTNNHGATGNTTWDNTNVALADYLLDTTLVNVPSSGGEEPEEPEEPTKELTSISVTWSATSADVGTNPSALITKVEATYSDGSKQTVTGYSVTPTTLVEGSQTVTVTYQGKTSTKTIVGNAIEIPTINGIELTTDDTTNWIDVTDTVLGEHATINADTSGTQQPYHKVGIYDSNGKQTLKFGVDIQCASKSNLYTLNALSNNVSTRGSNSFVEFGTSSSFSVEGLGAATSKKLRVIIKGMTITNVDSEASKVIDKDDFYYTSGTNIAYANGVKPTTRADGNIQIDFIGSGSQKFGIWNSSIMSSAQTSTSEQYKVRIEGVAILLQK